LIGVAARFLDLFGRPLRVGRVRFRHFVEQTLRSIQVLRLLDPVSDLVLIHNHPHSLGFSADDLVQLEKPGVTAVVAVGHDGSVYIAARGRLYDRDMFEPVQYAAARKAVTLGVREALVAHMLTDERVDAHFAHLISLALERAGVIDYYTDLAPERRSQFDTARVAFAQLVAFAASRVR
jgi:hypothetical protein